MKAWIVAGTIVLTLVSVPVQAQDPEPGDPRDVLYAFEYLPNRTFAQVPVNGMAEFSITINDHSRDSSTGLTGQPGGARPRGHQTTWSISGDTAIPIGWTVTPPSTALTFGGDTLDVVFRVEVIQVVQDPLIEFTLLAKTQTIDGTFVTPLTFGALTFGPNVFNVSPIGSLQIQPDEVGTQMLRITNGQLQPREFQLQVIDNTCGLPVAHDATFMVPADSTRDVAVTIRGPADQFWYNSELCQLSVEVIPLDQPTQFRSVPLSVQVTGGYINPVWVFWAIGAAAAIVILAAMARRRKQIIEEEILGKPQKPWTIPVERVYLEHLEERDPRAAYVVRHFLMEEEYASSLLWYKHYKQTTRGQRSKEALVVRQERKYERFQNKWQKLVAAPIKDADRFEAKLQKKLDRQAKATVRKDRRNWKKLVGKIEKAHASRELKANAKWEKVAKKAEKKGQPAPPKPQLAPPDLPEEPQLQKIHLEDHKWNKKAIKFRKKMVKRQGDIEVKFEKKDARMLHKLRRKVQKIARKLDDPDFVDEHPLLAKGA